MTLRKAAAFIAVALLLSCRPQPEVSINGQRFVVETAVTPQERSRGLMFRESLPKNHGMLFIFESEQMLSFWMQNTSIPLSIAYINADGVIVDILDMNPFDLTAVPSSRPAMYALEVNQGEFEKRGIRPGNRVIFSEEINQRNSGKFFAISSRSCAIGSPTTFEYDPMILKKRSSPEF